MHSEITNIIIKDKIAHGAFGEIYEGEDAITGRKIVVKIEKEKSNILKHEYFVYQMIPSENTPKVYECGKIIFNGAYHNCMTMELLGCSLEKIFNRLNRAFSLKTIYMIGKQCLERIEYLHLKHYIHRDIKPDNFVLSLDMRKIYLIDYGLAKEYRNPKTLIHRPIKTGKNLTGTVRYASLNTHIGIEQSRRDDLEGLGYMLIYFLRGRLPWQGLKAKDKFEKYAKIKQQKEETSLEELCEGLPQEFYHYMIRVRNLQYDEYPDYVELRFLFEKGLRSKGMEDDGIFDWMINIFNK